jgi:hypothetical protein
MADDRRHAESVIGDRTRGDAASERPRTALLIDWGGVLTSNLFASF